MIDDEVKLHCKHSCENECATYVIIVLRYIWSYLLSKVKARV